MLGFGAVFNVNDDQAPGGSRPVVGRHRPGEHDLGGCGIQVLSMGVIVGKPNRQSLVPVEAMYCVEHQAVYPLTDICVQSVTVTRQGPVQLQALAVSLWAGIVYIRPGLVIINSLAAEVLRLPGGGCIGRPQDRFVLLDSLLPSGRVATIHGSDLVHDFAFFNSVSHT